jgi:hypothetical protein
LPPPVASTFIVAHHRWLLRNRKGNVGGITLLDAGAFLTGHTNPLVIYSRASMMRLAALALLALMFVDLGTDLLYGERGERLESVPTLSGAELTIQRALPPGQDNSLHECFCCCSHIEPQVSLVPEVLFISTPGFVHAEAALPEVFPLSLLHPPLTA